MKERFILLFFLFLGFRTFSDDEGIVIKFDGYFRTYGHYLHNLDEKENYTNTGFLDMRFRLEPEFRITENLLIKSQVDMLDNVVWGYYPRGEEISFLKNAPNNYGIDSLSDSPEGTLIDYFSPTGATRAVNLKRVWLEISFFLGKLKIGRMGSNWGMGIYENDGNEHTANAERMHKKIFRQEWGLSRFGDTRDSILFATKPLGMDRPFFLAFGFDKFSEGNVYISSDDVDRWFIIPLYLDRERKIYGGAHISYLIQSGSNTKIWVFDPYLRWHFPFDYDFLLEAESTIYLGETKAFGPGILGSTGEKLDIFAVNAVGRLSYFLNPFEFMGEFGYSSPEKEGFGDGKISSIPLDPDFNISLLTFEYVNAYYTGLFKNLSGEEMQLLRSNSSISNAIWGRCQIKFMPVETLSSAVQVLWAQGLEPLLYAYGQGQNPRGAGHAKHYGWELDWNLHFGFGEHLFFDLQLGFLWPGRGLSQYLENNEIKKNSMIFGMLGGFTAVF